MIYYALLTLLFACAKPVHVSQIDKARTAFETSDCLEILRTKISESDCPQLSYTYISDFDLIIRCHKEDSDRGDFWDNYFFRISAPYLQYSVQDQIIIDKHTICIDEYTRIEAYSPEE